MSEGHCTTNISNVYIIDFRMSVCSYSNTLLNVKIDGNTSSFIRLSVGVLGPLLFLICINYLPACLTLTSINIYAGDSVIIAADSTFKKVDVICQTDDDNIVKWFSKQD